MDWQEIMQRRATTREPVELLIREEVQKAVLARLGLKEFFREAVFQGGTALRLFYGNPRLSEGLDFVYRQPNRPVTLVAIGWLRCSMTCTWKN